MARRHVLGTCRRWFESNLSDHFGRLSLWGDYLSYKEDRAGFDPLAAYQLPQSSKAGHLPFKQENAGSNPVCGSTLRGLPVQTKAFNPMVHGLDTHTAHHSTQETEHD